MEYKVLYRKYRPTDFEQIVGQDYIINILKKAIINNKLSHAYLFSGPRGTGKTSTAKVFAKAINCENNITGDPCNKCSSCLEFDDNPDIIEIDAASNNGVDEIRELRNNVKLVPALSKYKVYIIDEVHMLSIGAFNALLKTLEEPPAHVIFILATTDPQKIPVTVISRCQRFDFQQLSVEIISKYLLKICESEKIKASKEATDEIAYLSEGAMRDALGILDQVVGSIDGDLTIDKIEKTIKVISKGKIEELFEALEIGDFGSVSLIVNEVEKNGYDFTSFVNKLVSFLREKAISVKRNEKNSKLGFTEIKNLIFSLNKILYNSKTEISPFLLLEIELLDNTKEESCQKVEKEEGLKEEIKSQEETLPPKVSDNETKKVRVNNCFVGANKDCLTTNKKKWEEYINSESELDCKIYSYIIDSKVVASSDKYLVLSSSSDSQSALFNKNKEEIEKSFFEYCGLKLLMIMLFDDEWSSFKEKYISDKKNNINYEIMEETNSKKKNIAESKLGKLAYKIFDEKNIKVE